MRLVSSSALLLSVFTIAVGDAGKLPNFIIMLMDDVSITPWYYPHEHLEDLKRNYLDSTIVECPL